MQELVDVGQAIGSLSQSFCFAGTFKSGVAWTDGTCYVDIKDFCQTTTQSEFTPPGGISLSVTPGPSNGHGVSLAAPGPGGESLN